MQQITDLGSDAKQTFRIQIENGKLATFTFTYMDNQIGWFFDVEYEGFISKGLRVTKYFIFYLLVQILQILMLHI